MGTFGTDLFEDDLAVEVRTRFGDLLAGGLDATAATNTIVTQMVRIIEDPDDGPVFWLALAGTQAKLGRLDPRVRDRALAAMDRDLDRWQREAPERTSERRLVLTRLSAALAKPPRSPSPARRLPPPRFAPGDVVAYRCDDDRQVVYRVVGLRRVRGGEPMPIMELLGHAGTDTSRDVGRRGPHGRPYVVSLSTGLADLKRITFLSHGSQADLQPLESDIWFGNWRSLGAAMCPRG